MHTRKVPWHNVSECPRRRYAMRRDGRMRKDMQVYRGDASICASVRFQMFRCVVKQLWVTGHRRWRRQIMHAIRTRCLRAFHVQLYCKCALYETIPHSVACNKSFGKTENVWAYGMKAIAMELHHWYRCSLCHVQQAMPAARQREVQKKPNELLSKSIFLSPAPQTIFIGEPLLGCVVRTTWPAALYSPWFLSLPHADTRLSFSVFLSGPSAACVFASKQTRWDMDPAKAYGHDHRDYVAWLTVPMLSVLLWNDGWFFENG